MFRVDNADFIADKLASELLPNQEYREVLQNALEAVRRRMDAEGVTTGGRIEFDVDWSLLTETGQWFLCCADNGDGMTRSELERYTTTLAVRGAGRSQSLRHNQGMGLKISGPTRHKRGILVRSSKARELTMVQVGWDDQTHQYGLISVGPDGELVADVGSDVFPRFVCEQGSGTVVSFLGNSDGDNTFMPGTHKSWLFKYLNMRYFRLSGDDIEVFVRPPSGNIEDWPRTYADAQKLKAWNLQKVYGTAAIWSQAAETQGPGYSGTVNLGGDPVGGIPSADMHWWVLPEGPGTDVSTRTASGGSIAVLYQNELHDWRQTGQANPFFARLGVLFGKTRIAFVLEPKGTTISSDFARAHVLVQQGNSGRPVFESDAWGVWADEFRANMPERIKQTMLDEQSRLQAEDPERARRIRDRLKEVFQMLRPQRARRNRSGSLLAAGPEVAGAGEGEDRSHERRSGNSTRQGSGATRGIGSVLSQVGVEEGEAASQVFAALSLEPRWVNEHEADDFPIVNGNGNGLRDRAAGLAGEDGRTARMLLLNREFRGYQAILGAINDWANPEGDDAKGAVIESATQEWIEQKMVESVQGLRQLENGTTWLTQHYDDALSPVALTAAFMADRYHTLREVKRQVGNMRRPDVVAS